MNNIPKISDAEWKVMKVLWNNSPLTSTQIIESLKSDTTWNPKTIHTLISRLVKKEAVGIKKESSFNTYYPIVTEEECKNIETKSFLQKVYDGSLNLLVANFIKEQNLAPNEIEELKRLLDENENYERNDT